MLTPQDFTLDRPALAYLPRHAPRQESGLFPWLDCRSSDTILATATGQDREEDEDALEEAEDHRNQEEEDEEDYQDDRQQEDEEDDDEDDEIIRHDEIEDEEDCDDEDDEDEQEEEDGLNSAKRSFLHRPQSTPGSAIQ